MKHTHYWMICSSEDAKVCILSGRLLSLLLLTLASCDQLGSCREDSTSNERTLCCCFFRSLLLDLVISCQLLVLVVLFCICVEEVVVF